MTTTIPAVAPAAGSGASPQSLADGPAGRALLAIEQGHDARRWLRELVADPVMAHPDEATLFHGVPAVAFTLAAAGQQRPRAALDVHVDHVVRTRLAVAHRRMDSGRLAEKEEFDLISGLTGLGAYLLHRGTDDDLVRDVLRYLVRLSIPYPRGLPGWWATAGPTGRSRAWAGGHSNHGMAHGIAGPLTLLSVTLRRNIVVAGQAAAIDRICRWFDRWRCGTPPRAWWPETLSFSAHHQQRNGPSGPYRPSWCYGTPGIARALQVAGLALGDRTRQLQAENILTWCVTDPAQLGLLSDVSLCHGWAGVLHTVWRASQHSDQLAATLPGVHDGLITHLHHHPPTEPGLLTGATGVALAQRAARTGLPPRTGWDTCLLLTD